MLPYTDMGCWLLPFMVFGSLRNYHLKEWVYNVKTVILSRVQILLRISLKPPASHLISQPEENKKDDNQEPQIIWYSVKCIVEHHSNGRASHFVSHMSRGLNPWGNGAPKQQVRNARPGKELPLTNFNLVPKYLKQCVIAFQLAHKYRNKAILGSNQFRKSINSLSPVQQIKSDAGVYENFSIKACKYRLKKNMQVYVVRLHYLYTKQLLLVKAISGIKSTHVLG